MTRPRLARDLLLTESHLVTPPSDIIPGDLVIDTFVNEHVIGKQVGICLVVGVKSVHGLSGRTLRLLIPADGSVCYTYVGAGETLDIIRRS